MAKLQEPEASPAKPAAEASASTSEASASAPKPIPSPPAQTAAAASSEGPVPSSQTPASASVPRSPQSGTKKYYKPKNRSMVSTSDPDAAIVRKGPHGPRARYKNHRAVDDLCGVVTAVATTAGDVEENAKLIDLVDQHEQNTGCTTETVVADMQYGTVENFRACQQRGIHSHMADLTLSQAKKPCMQGIFGIEQFRYDSTSDTYRCPAGQTLTRRKHKKQRRAYEYACAAAICQECSMRQQCTRAKGTARTIKRHYDQGAIDAARTQSHSRAAKRDRQRRKWRMEGSFADAATHHGFKRARWRRLWRQRIQDLLIATVQNLRTLLHHAGHRTRGACSQAPTQAALAPHSLRTILDTQVALLQSFLKALRSRHCPEVEPLTIGVWSP